MSKKKRSPESRARTSEAIKKWWANRSEEEKIATSRKQSAIRQEMLSKMPKRAKRDIIKKKVESQKEHYKTYLGHVNKLYIGYLAKKDILECPPERKELWSARNSEGMKKAWARKTPEELEAFRQQAREKKIMSDQRVQFLYEEDVPREPTYCGVVQRELMYG